jgi:DNA-binding transcriptional regulator YhcF (GntR family)
MALNCIVRIDLAGLLPAYKQIADSLRTLIVERALTPGDRLPSVRRLGMELGVHFNTVSEAYRELAAEGLLDVRHGSGATVRDRGFVSAPSVERIAEFRERLRNLVTQMRAAGIPTAQVAAELSSVMEDLSSE